MTSPIGANAMDRRRFLTLSVVAFMASAAPAAFAQSAGDADAAYDSLLQRYVVVSPDGVNRVAYGRWRANAADRKALDDYVKSLEGRKPSAMPRDEAFAYWGNLYNAVTVKLILDRNPKVSIRDIKEGSWLDFKAYTGPWRQPRVTVEGKALSLDNIEHDIMRPTFKDPRVHYVVNCASYGCPNLMARAWRAATLEADLDAAAKAYVNHPRGVTVLPNGTLRVSSIYKWFVADFGGDDAGVIAHLRRYAAPELAQRLATAITIAEDAYDWALNDTDAQGKPKS
jgi:hypothetical protein